MNIFSESEEDIEPWVKPYVSVFEELGAEIREQMTGTDCEGLLDDCESNVKLASIHYDDAVMCVCYWLRSDKAKDEIEKIGLEVSDNWILNDRYYFRWCHRKAKDLLFDVEHLDIEREGLHANLQRYLADRFGQTEYFDRWFADTLCYQEIIGFAFNVKARRFLPGFLGGAGRKERKKNAHLLAEMLAAYQVLESYMFSWEVFWQELNRTRELGAVWPGELYRLVELRKSA